MSLDAIKEVRNAEDDARARRAETAAACKRIMSDADAEGKAILDEALAKAAAQERDIFKIAEAKADEESKAVLEKAGADALELEKAVEKNIVKAASFIVERIVSAQ